MPKIVHLILEVALCTAVAAAASGFLFRLLKVEGQNNQLWQWLAFGVAFSGAAIFFGSIVWIMLK